ncbi:MAG: hypothetical protein J6S05_05695 [Bacteroidaceae bacterium]|nr:hypothetical protein [Bacteroidaceae bacterium]
MSKIDSLKAQEFILKLIVDRVTAFRPIFIKNGIVYDVKGILKSRDFKKFLSDKKLLNDVILFEYDKLKKYQINRDFYINKDTLKIEGANEEKLDLSAKLEINHKCTFEILNEFNYFKDQKLSISSKEYIKKIVKILLMVILH